MDLAQLPRENGIRLRGQSVTRLETFVDALCDPRHVLVAVVDVAQKVLELAGPLGIGPRGGPKHGLAHLQHVAHGLRGAVAASISCLEAAAFLLRSTPYTLELADALLWLAQARQLAGSPDTARAALGEARLVLERLPELGILAERWDATERMLSGDQPTVPPAVLVSVDELSAREREVLQLLPTALSEAEIGQELFISYHTVHSHVRTIYRKLGTTSRAQTVERARATRQLPTPRGRSADGAGGEAARARRRACMKKTKITAVVIRPEMTTDASG